MARVLIPLAKGFEDIEAVTVVDVLRRGGVEVVTASMHETLDVKSAHGVTMRADVLFADVKDADYDAIVLPGGGEGTENLKASVSLIRRVLDPGVHVTCYPSCQMELDREWSPASVVADGLVITGQAPGSALLFALVVLQTLKGEPVAKKVARGMVTDVL